jgi:TrmH family RNA methyltransferase
VDLIASRQNPLVARCRRLASGRPHGTHDVLLDGWHVVQEALRAGVPTEVVVVSERAIAAGSDDVRAVLEHANALGVRILRASDRVLEAMSPVHSPAGVVAIARQTPAPFDNLFHPPPAMVFIAIDVQDPGNVGAIIRVAHAAGGTGVVAAGASADPWGWKAVRGAMGSTFRLPVLREAEVGALLTQLSQRGVQLLATAGRGGIAIYDHDFRPATAVLLGGEGAGLAPDVQRFVDAIISIPMSGGVDSLNVATAAAVIAFEAHRQRRPDA